MSQRRNYPQELAIQCAQALRLSERPKLELAFHPTRKWRFDVAFVEHKLAVEVEGGVFLPGGGRHTRGVTFEKDAEKYAEAAILGWTVIRVTPRQVKNGQAVRWIERWLRRAA